MKRTLILCTILTLAIGACSDGGGAVTTSTTAGTTTTTGGSTTTTPPSTTTTGGSPSTTAAPVFVVDAANFLPPVTPDSGEAHGSGCVTGADTLPDGIWFGFVTAYSGGDLTFDLACFFTGQAAIDAATADGAEAFDFYIRNVNPKKYTVALSGDGTAWYLDVSSGDVTPIAIDATAWPVGVGYNDCPGDFCPAWLYVNGGVATELVEQYLP